MKLWKCSLCGKVGLWGPTWTSFSSFVVDDEWPSYRVVCCSKVCEESAERGHKSGEIALPKFRMSASGSRMTKEQRGYRPQPTQRLLAEEWNEVNPDNPISLELFR